MNTEIRAFIPEKYYVIGQDKHTKLARFASIEYGYGDKSHLCYVSFYYARNFAVNLITQYSNLIAIPGFQETKTADNIGLYELIFSMERV